MKFYLILIICCVFCAAPAHAFGRKHNNNGLATTEVELMNKVLDCLKNRDTIGYYNLFPPFDTLWKMVMHNPDQSPDVVRELNKLKEHPTVLIDFDPYYNHAILGRFEAALRKGEDSGIQWKGIVMQRFELQKENLTRGMEGLQLIIPDRFRGFMFVRDLLSSTTYCITITEIQKIDGYYFGGQVLNVLEASNVDQYLARENAERKRFAYLRDHPEEKKKEVVPADSLAGAVLIADSLREDSIKQAAKTVKASGPVLPPDTAKIRKQLLLSVPSPDDEAAKTRREVVDRRYYKGKFDDEIPVELYVRYMKDASGKANDWDALYKFGDMSKYIRLEVSKAPDGKWLFEEPVATMELELSQKVYTGTWTNGENQTGYDVELTQHALAQAKIVALDRILENKVWGKTDQQEIIEKAEQEDRDNDNKSTEAERKKAEKGEDNKKTAPPAEVKAAGDQPAAPGGEPGSDKKEPKKDTAAGKEPIKPEDKKMSRKEARKERRKEIEGKKDDAPPVKDVKKEDAPAKDTPKEDEPKKVPKKDDDGDDD